MKHETHLTRLVLYRRSRGWRLIDLAHFLGRGFSPAVLSLLESGRLRPSTSQQACFREMLGQDVEYMCEQLDPAALLACIEKHYRKARKAP